MNVAENVLLVSFYSTMPPELRYVRCRLTESVCGQIIAGKGDIVWQSYDKKTFVGI